MGPTIMSKDFQATPFSMQNTDGNTLGLVLNRLWKRHGPFGVQNVARTSTMVALNGSWMQTIAIQFATTIEDINTTMDGRSGTLFGGKYVEVPPSDERLAHYACLAVFVLGENFVVVGNGIFL